MDMNVPDNVVPFVRGPAVEPRADRSAHLVIERLRAIAEGIEQGILPAVHAVLVTQDGDGETMTAYLTPESTPPEIAVGMLSDAVGDAAYRLTAGPA
jgi:hypothetical protein